MTTPPTPDIFQGKVITIDGPAGSGKSTTARLLAQRLGFEYLDTGATYRAVAVLVRDEGISLEGAEAVERLLQKFDLRFEARADKNHVFLRGVDVTEAIRTPEIDKLVTPVADHIGIRRFLGKWQRERAAAGSVVLEGRDTGTVVCPKADVKIFLVASLETRARRRMKDFERAGLPASLDELRADIVRRDKADESRPEGPLVPAPDAIFVDTSDLTVEEQVDKVYEICMDRLLDGD